MRSVRVPENRSGELRPEAPPASLSSAEVRGAGERRGLGVDDAQLARCLGRTPGPFGRGCRTGLASVGETPMPETRCGELLVAMGAIASEEDEGCCDDRGRVRRGRVGVGLSCLGVGTDGGMTVVVERRTLARCQQHCRIDQLNSISRSSFVSIVHRPSQKWRSRIAQFWIPKGFRSPFPLPSARFSSCTRRDTHNNKLDPGFVSLDSR